MSAPNKNTHEDDRKPAAKKDPIPSVPEWRSVAIARPQSLAFPAPSFGVPKFGSSSDDVIDKASYFVPTPTKISASPTKEGKKWSPWAPKELRPVPAFYPLERSSRFVKHDLADVVERIAEANRLLSIHAVYCNENATATLFTCENVEMHLSLWEASGDEEGIVVELQRRKGDSIFFHRYSRCILDTAAGELDIKEQVKENGDDIDSIFAKKLQRSLTLDPPIDSKSESENAVIALEIANGLIKKDRIDARQLGLESLCLLTDPKKTGYTTAVIASRVVLLGSARDIDYNANPEEALLIDETPFQEIRQALLSLIQFRRIGEDDDLADEETDESEHMTALHNLALAVLANALDVIGDDDMDSVSSDPDISSGRARLDTSESISERFLEDSLEFSENREIMKTLISELGKAGMKPHNACLSAKCIGSLCKASEKARKRAKELGAKNVVQTALEVGTKTHLKLERECNKIMSSLTESNNE